jgi:hypothetical protein
MRPYSRKNTLFVIMLTVATGCTTTTVVHENPTLPEIPEYVKVPHPSNFELASLRSIFHSPLAPENVEGEFVTTCDSEFMKLASLSNSIEERSTAADELVAIDPERMHWCFYGKISKLQDTLQSDSTWSERQKKVFETFVFLTPIANSFMSVYHDSRYLRWATQYYSKISEWVFFKKVVPTPETSSMLVEGANSLVMDSWIAIDSQRGKDESVFTKYGISLAPTVASGTNPLDMTSRVPASADSNPDAPPTAPGKGPMKEGVDLETKELENAPVSTP